MDSVEKPKARGCLFWCGMVAAFLFFIAILAGYGAYRFVKNAVSDYTDTRPIAMPGAQLSSAELTNLQVRVKTFDDAMQSNRPVGPLVLTSDEINSLINRSSTTNRGPDVRFYFTFNEDRVQAQLSLPLSDLGINMLRGRYLNGSGDMMFSMSHGRVVLNVKSVSVKGRPLPEQWMQSIRTENFAATWTNNPDMGDTFSRVEAIRIQDGKMIIIPNTNPPPVVPPSTNELESAPKLEAGK